MSIEPGRGIVVLAAIVERDGCMLVTRRVHGKLLVQLAAKTRLEGFVRLAFSAWEFPIAGEVDTLLPPRDQEPAAVLDHRGHDVHGRVRHARDGLRAGRRCGDVRQKPFIGHPSQRGVRGAQTVAPRSISP